MKEKTVLGPSLSDVLTFLEVVRRMCAAFKAGFNLIQCFEFASRDYQWIPAREILKINKAGKKFVDALMEYDGPGFLPMEFRKMLVDAKARTKSAFPENSSEILHEAFRDFITWFEASLQGGLKKASQIDLEVVPDKIGLDRKRDNSEIYKD